MRNWRKSMKRLGNKMRRPQTRAQTLKQQGQQGQQQLGQQQEQQSFGDDVAKQPDSPVSQPKESSILSIFVNDFTDADNEAAAMLWAQSLDLCGDITKGIYIAEPRHVNLGYYMTANEFGACINLVNKLGLPEERGVSALRIVLGGYELDDDYIEKNQQKLGPEERDLLKRCRRPKNGERDDAIIHARLVALDYLTTMRSRCDRDFDAYIDVACLKELESPINLKTHYHDELIARTAAELRSFRDITALSTSSDTEIEARRDKLRVWYEGAVDRKIQNDFNGKLPIKDMEDYQDLYQNIQDHDRTIILGGASLTIVKHILEERPELAKKVEYYQQGGTYNEKLNILGKPLNFALNPKAAKFVFDDKQKGKLGKLVLVSTTTTQQLQFTARGLTELHPAVGVRAVGFFGRLDPWALISPEEEDPQQQDFEKTDAFLFWRAENARKKFCKDGFKGNHAVMADLVAFLICFTNIFEGDSFKVVPENKVKVQKHEEQAAMSYPPDDVGDESMLLKKDNEGPIKSMMLEIFGLPDGEKAVLVDDASSLAEKAMEMFYIPGSRPS